MANNGTKNTDPAKSWLGTIGGFAGLFYTYDMTDSLLAAFIGMIIGAILGYAVENILFRIFLVIMALIEAVLKSGWFWKAVLNG